MDSYCVIYLHSPSDGKKYYRYSSLRIHFPWGLRNGSIGSLAIWTSRTTKALEGESGFGAGVDTSTAERKTGAKESLLLQKYATELCDIGCFSELARRDFSVSSMCQQVFELDPKLQVLHWSVCRNGVTIGKSMLAARARKILSIY